MLYIPKHHIAFVHYPKTAGTSVLHLLHGCFSDAVELGPTHCGIRESRRILRRPKHWSRTGFRGTRSLKFFGVVREPKDMLVSLFSYWGGRHTELRPEMPMHAAVLANDFEKFIHHAVLKRDLPNYRNFFDFQGSCWRATRLILFDNIRAEVAALVRDMTSVTPPEISSYNSSPADPIKQEEYRGLAYGKFAGHITEYFKWYYSNFGALRRSLSA